MSRNAYQKMKKHELTTTVVTTTILAILVLNAISISVLPVVADRQGIGKFLTVEIIGEGYVTATKVKTGDVWNYTKTSIPTEHKLGAGTVSIRAHADEGWEFSHWEEDLTGTENPVEYKSEKYGYIKAVFRKVEFTITATVPEEAFNGTIIVGDGDGVATSIPRGWNVTIGYGGSQTFEFNALEGNHISAIQVDGIFVEYIFTYTFTDVQDDHTLTVYFSMDGQAYVPIGTNVPVYLGDNVGLTFTSIYGGGTATQIDVLSSLLLQLQGTSLILWDVNVGAMFSGLVEIALPYEGATISKVWTSDSLDALYCDVNGDGIVDGDDVSDVAVGIKTTVSSGAEYDPQFDTNRDGHLTEDDVHLVNQYKGTVLEEILDFWIEGNTLFIQTDHFSIFRGR